MDIGKSTKIALVKNGCSQGWLAKELGVSRQRATAIANSKEAGAKTLERLANVFGMSISEFIALGE